MNKTLVMFLAGVAAGTLAGVLIAPQSGKETCNGIRRAADKIVACIDVFGGAAAEPIDISPETESNNPSEMMQFE